MKLHLDIDCTSLDDLKSARATIDRLIQEVEGRQKDKAEAAAKFLREGMKDVGRRTIEEMRKVLNPPLRREDRRGGDTEVVTDDVTGDKFTVEPLDIDQWKCVKCGTVNDVRHGEVCQCGVRSDGKNMRTRSQVLKQRCNSVMGGCCERFTNQMGCDCLETALPDAPEVVVHQCPNCGNTMANRLLIKRYYRCTECGHNMRCDECGAINCRQPNH